MQLFKAQAFTDVAAFVQISADQYGAKLAAPKAMYNFWLLMAVLRFNAISQSALFLWWTPQAAKHLIDECLKEWTADGRDEIKAIISSAFNVDKKGEISTTKILP